MMKKKGFAVIAVAMLLMLLLNVQAEEREKEAPLLSYNAFLEKMDTGHVEKVYFSDQAFWQVEMEDGTKHKTPNPRSAEMKETMLKMGVNVVEQTRVEMMPLLLMGGICALMFTRKKGTMGTINSDAQPSVPDKTFQDVVIDEETKKAMMDLTHYLKEPEVYRRMGARPPRGVLLYGPPGTGKTLLARALAGETGKGFFAVSGSDFVEVYVGVGAARIRSLFKKARKAGGGVIFIDEIDALGKKRENANDEREQTLNALLTEMNGFRQEEGIIVLAATNRPETLDAALLREGRFDRRIEIGLPDAEGRKKMLEVHGRNKPLAKDADLFALAKRTAFFSGAQLESLMNEAAIRAVREGTEEIAWRHLEEACYVQVAGEERRRQMQEKEKNILAVHEAGHAVLTHFLLPESTLSRVTILPTGKGAAGYSLAVMPDRLFHTRRELLCHMAVALGGRMAEEMVFGRENVTNGAANDLEKAEEMARQMVKWRMAEGEKAQEELLGEAGKLALDTLKAKADCLHRLKEALLEKETLNGDEILQFVA